MTWIRFCRSSDTSADRIELPNQARVALPRTWRGNLFEAVIAPEAARTSKRRNTAFGTDPGPGEDEDAILSRDLDHTPQCNAPRPGTDERLREGASIVAGVILLLAIGCGEPSPKTDAELGLNARQSSGRRIFERDCAACHSAYSSSGSKGPSLKNVFRKKFLPSGLPANDRFVEQTIVGGRNVMPPMGEALTPQELDDLMSYLHSL